MKQFVVLITALALMTSVIGCNKEAESSAPVEPPVDDAGNVPDAGQDESMQ